LAIEGKISVQQVNYTKLAIRLTADKQILVWADKEAASQSDRPAR